MATQNNPQEPVKAVPSFASIPVAVDNTKSTFNAIKDHPATRRLGRNVLRGGVIGVGYTLVDEALNRTSF